MFSYLDALKLKVKIQLEPTKPVTPSPIYTITYPEIGYGDIRNAHSVAFALTFFESRSVYERSWSEKDLRRVVI